MFLFLRKLTAFIFVMAIWTLVLFAYLFATRADRNMSNDLLTVAFLIIVAVVLTWLVQRFYFSRSGQNSVCVITIDTLIVSATGLAIFWLVPDMIALFEDFGGDLPRITKLAIILHPYIMLLPLTALLVLLFSVHSQHTQTPTVYLLRLSHSLLILSSGMSIFYLGAMYAPLMRMCSVV
ncbi:hypothetical protein [Thioflexithrix psekupsensis]|uniref:Uncharacterized protein n=1 Tax=Thioflexithrix psekupsensis TaxID=1570016 RepID=A0A251X774_9GAMM|nr:hypothetical protein [Thioflexithrix psekupsensis]OUD13180.1 hypothetical protein TPSD3_11095 [Thioflexithrix psekupsensis]